MLDLRQRISLWGYNLHHHVTTAARLNPCTVASSNSLEPPVSMLYETKFLLALVTTWVIEIPLLIILVRIVYHKSEMPVNKIFFTGLLCTALTLPYLWFVLPPFVDAAYYPMIGEALVVNVEAGILNRVLGLDLKRSVLCSVAMNVLSYMLGLFLL